MKPEEFTRYVDSQLRQGISREALISNLLAGGWTKEQVDQAFVVHDKVIRKELSPTPIHKYTKGEMVMVVVLIIFILLTCLFILGGE